MFTAARVCLKHGLCGSGKVAGAVGSRENMLHADCVVVAWSLRPGVRRCGLPAASSTRGSLQCAAAWSRACRASSKRPGGAAVTEACVMSGGGTITVARAVPEGRTGVETAPLHHAYARRETVQQARRAHKRALQLCRGDARKAHPRTLPRAHAPARLLEPLQTLHLPLQAPLGQLDRVPSGHRTL